MDDFKRVMYETPVLVGVLLAGLFFGLFGAMNWNNHLYPSVPLITERTPQLQAEARMDAYHRDVAEVGQKAVVPLVWAVPICVTGFGLAAVCMVTLLYKYSP